MITYGFEKAVDLNFEEAEKQITAEMKKEGFGIVSKVNMKDKFKEKLNIDYKNYIILGFCNPPSAHEAVESEENIGLLLPCNVVVYDKDNKTNISVIKPSVAMSMVDNPGLGAMAMKIGEKLKSALERV